MRHYYIQRRIEPKLPNPSIEICRPILRLDPEWQFLVSKYLQKLNLLFQDNINSHTIVLFSLIHLNNNNHNITESTASSSTKLNDIVVVNLALCSDVQVKKEVENVPDAPQSLNLQRVSNCYVAIECRVVKRFYCWHLDHLWAHCPNGCTRCKQMSLLLLLFSIFFRHWLYSWIHEYEIHVSKRSDGYRLYRPVRVQKVKNFIWQFQRL